MFGISLHLCRSWFENSDLKCDHAFQQIFAFGVTDSAI